MSAASAATIAAVAGTVSCLVALGLVRGHLADSLLAKITVVATAVVCFAALGIAIGKAADDNDSTETNASESSGANIENSAMNRDGEAD